MIFLFNWNMLSLLLEKKTRYLEPTLSEDQWLLKRYTRKYRKHSQSKNRQERKWKMQHLDVFNAVLVIDLKKKNCIQTSTTSPNLPVDFKCLQQDFLYVAQNGLWKMRESDHIIQFCIDRSLPVHDINDYQICSWVLSRDKNIIFRRSINLQCKLTSVRGFSQLNATPKKIKK